MDEEHFKFFITIVILYTLLFFTVAVSVCRGESIPEDQAVRAIIGESSGEGYKGMLAVAAAIRNRGTLQGVYGVHAKHIDKEPQWVWDLARKAWKESENQDPTGGATHWESIKFKEPYWAKSMIKTVLIGNHQFYRGGDINDQ